MIKTEDICLNLSNLSNCLHKNDIIINLQLSNKCSWLQNAVEWEYKIVQNVNTEVKYKHFKIVLKYFSKCIKLYHSTAYYNDISTR